MATFKLTAKLGGKAQDVVKSAGSAIAGSDAIEINVDATTMSKAETLQLIEYAVQQIVEKGFPQ